jgi:serine/threonine protein phosphatase PrpC
MLNVDGGLSSGAHRPNDSADEGIEVESNDQTSGGVFAPQVSVAVTVETPPRPTVVDPPPSLEPHFPNLQQSRDAADNPHSEGSAVELSADSVGHDDSSVRSRRSIGSRRKRSNRWRSAKSNIAEGGPELSSTPTASAVAMDDVPAIPEKDKRSVNGPLVVEFDSPLNRKVWHSDGWTKFPEAGPSRDLETEYGNVGNLRVVAGSMRGTKHKYYGDPNQDAYAIRSTDDHVIVAVSDGVSSAKYSAFASKYLTDLVVRRLQQGLSGRSKPTRDEVRLAVQHAVESASAGVSCWREGELFAPDEPCNAVDVRELAATLTVAVIEVEPSHERTRDVLVAFVGDSPCYVLTGYEWTIKTSESKTGDVIDHTTSALPVREGRPVNLDWAEFEIGASDALLVMTDGIGTSLASGRSAVGRWMAPRVASLLGPQIESNFFDLISFDRNGEDDDRTLVVVLDINTTESAGQEGETSADQ